MSFFIKITKIVVSEILSTNRLVRLRYRKTSLPDQPAYYYLVGDIPIYPDGTLVNPLYISQYIEVGECYTFWAELYGGESIKKNFCFPATTVPPTTTQPSSYLLASNGNYLLLSGENKILI